MSQQTEMDLSNLGQLLKSKMELVALESEQIKDLKKQIRAIMINNDMEEFENPDLALYIKCTRSFSFDFGAFKMDYPVLTKRYFTEETITTVRDVYDKKKIKKEHPIEYKSCEIQLTPRLTVK